MAALDGRSLGGCVARVDAFGGPSVMPRFVLGRVFAFSDG